MYLHGLDFPIDVLVSSKAPGFEGPRVPLRVERLVVVVNGDNPHLMFYVGDTAYQVNLKELPCL